MFAVVVGVSGVDVGAAVENQKPFAVDVSPMELATCWWKLPPERPSRVMVLLLWLGLYSIAIGATAVPSTSINESTIGRGSPAIFWRHLEPRRWCSQGSYIDPPGTKKTPTNVPLATPEKRRLPLWLRRPRLTEASEAFELEFNGTAQK